MKATCKLCGQTLDGFGSTQEEMIASLIETSSAHMGEHPQEMQQIYEASLEFLAVRAFSHMRVDQFVRSRLDVMAGRLRTSLMPTAQ